MKIVFVEEFNTPQRGFDVGQLVDLPTKEAKAFIKSNHARKAIKADEKVSEDKE